MSKAVAIKLKTYCKLGLRNVAKVCCYRMQVKSGWFKLTLPKGRLLTLPSIIVGDVETDYNLSVNTHEIRYFFKHSQFFDGTPDWHKNYLTGYSWRSSMLVHWSTLGYFVKPGEDIKGVWEISRFYWATEFALSYKLNRDTDSIVTLDSWLKSWMLSNRVNCGVNWLCAQEVSIRLVNFILTVKILKIPFNDDILKFCLAHMKRIAATLHYGDGQCNDHASSEAVALYIGSTFLMGEYALVSCLLNKFQKVAIKQLERISEKLIFDDGGFANYSVSYHRMVLDAFVLALHFQQKYHHLSFSKKLIIQLNKMFDWLYSVTDPASGDVPNLGSNDGSMYYKLDRCDFRDFRPTLQFACFVLKGHLLYKEGPWNGALDALNLDFDPAVFRLLERKSVEKSASGVAIFVEKNHWALLNYPVYKFRPSQSDALHLDVWVRGHNVFCDAGTFSYSASESDMSFFSGVCSHNTVQFDSRQQMPRLSRFLFGSWLKCEKIQFLEKTGINCWSWGGTIIDGFGCSHRRDVTQSANHYVIRDYLDGPCQEATIRWNSPELEWELQNQDWSCDFVTIKLFCNGSPITYIKKHGKRSLYYMSHQSTVVFEHVVSEFPALIETIIQVK